LVYEWIVRRRVRYLPALRRGTGSAGEGWVPVCSVPELVPRNVVRLTHVKRALRDAPFFGNLLGDSIQCLALVVIERIAKRTVVEGLCLNRSVVSIVNLWPATARVERNALGICCGMGHLPALQP